MANILSINSGSSSIKFALYGIPERAARAPLPVSIEKHSQLLFGSVERIGLSDTLFRLFTAEAKKSTDKSSHVANHKAALELIIEALGAHEQTLNLAAVGHRIVHGGPAYDAPHLVTPQLVDELRSLIPLAPHHLPNEIQAIETVQQLFPGIKQVACFDTAFHRNMPTVAKTYALPKHLGISRYGFHGLSCEYICEELAKQGNAEGRIIIAHLGNGASMTAVVAGKSMDTTMGFTPAGGLVMGTRPGDLDPGIMSYIGREKKVTAQEMDDLINRHSGLLAVSGSSSDMEDLIARYSRDSRAREAVELFCYSARKAVGALAAVLGGVDALVFTAGIGENAPFVRSRICESLDFLGIRLAEDRNSLNAEIISMDGSPVTVRIIQTDEALMITRHTHRLMQCNELESHCA